MRLALAGRVLAATVLTQLSGCGSASDPVPLAAHVDLDAMQGGWYIVATIPNRFERGMVAPYDVYSRRPDADLREDFDSICVAAVSMRRKSISWCVMRSGRERTTQAGGFTSSGRSACRFWCFIPTRSTALCCSARTTGRWAGCTRARRISTTRTTRHCLRPLPATQAFASTLSTEITAFSAASHAPSMPALTRQLCSPAKYMAPTGCPTRSA